MAKFYSTAKLSERISTTPEGFLICEGVAITRAGDLLYAPGETPITLKEGVNYVTVSRTVEDIHDLDTIASFEGKSVTINHPDDFVTPDNWRELTVGMIQNVRPGTGEDADKLLADLLITDAEAIAMVKAKRLREVSCGYEAEYVEESPGRGRQQSIIGNHVALVAAGRCGSECAIFDHAPKLETQMTIKKSIKDRLMAAFGKALDEAEPDEGASLDAAGIAAAIDALVKRMDALEGKGKDAEGADPVDKRLAVIETALSKLLGMEEAEAAAAATGDADAEAKKAADEAAALAETEAKKVADAAIAAAAAAQPEMCTDAEVIARAEILAPGIVKTADVKVKSIDAAYATEEGKAVIDVLLAGKAMDAADKDILFVAASEMLKGVRRQKLNDASQHVVLDSLKAGDMTPEKINAMNAERYGK